MNSIITEFGHAVTRSIAYHSVGAVMRGEGLIPTLLIGAAILCVVYIIFRKIGR